MHSAGSDIIYLAGGVKNTINLRDFLASFGYPIGYETPTFEDN
jgi:hypothetical protein